MRHEIFLLLLVTGVQHALAQVDARGIFMADPTIFVYGDKYYLYGTNGVSADSGFSVLVSSDLQNWQAEKNRALQKEYTYGDKGFWAPQVFSANKKIYMAYTANQQIAIAESVIPTGLFKQQIHHKLPSQGKQIDPFVFEDNNGIRYLYHVRLENGNRIFVAELKADLSDIVAGTLREIIVADKGWENTDAAIWPVTEGPTVIKISNKYILFYSANDFRNPDYAVGYAVAHHPLGPCVKSSQNPIISKAVTGYNGSGHGDIVEDKDGAYHYVFHTHYSQTQVAPRRTAIVQLNIFSKDKDVFVEVVPKSIRLLKK